MYVDLNSVVTKNNKAVKNNCEGRGGCSLFAPKKACHFALKLIK